MYALVDIRYSAEFNGGVAEQIAAPVASSLSAAFLELYQASGEKPRVLRPYGGARTAQQCWDKKLSPYISDHWEGAWVERGRAAVDIDNQVKLRALLGDIRFESILRRHGWQNVTVTGDPFPNEPWHFATRASWLAALDVQPLTERHTPMSSTVPIRYQLSGAAAWARKRGDGPFAVIERTAVLATAKQWVADVGVDPVDYRTDAAAAAAALTRWATEIATDKTAYATLHQDVTLAEDEAQIIAGVLAGIHIPTPQEYAEAVADEEHDRLAE